MIETISNRQDRFGYYTVGDFKSYSKLECVYEHLRTNKPLAWNFNENVFGSLDWTKEPEQSLEELYRQHAQLLRERYDYLVLWFSGGADSTNILNTFITNNIRLDEVVSYVNYEASGDKYNFLNGEIYNVAVPKIEEVKKLHQPWLHHRLIDVSQLMVDAFHEKEIKFDWIYNMNNYFNPNAVGRRNVKQKIPEWMALINSGKRVGFIHGIDKPRVTGINGKFYYRFLDMIDTSVTPEMQRANHEWEHDELFYWSPDAPLIPLKQAHIIKKYIRHATTSTPGFTTDPNCLSPVLTTISGTLYKLTLPTLHKLIYPGWYPVPYQFKPKSTFFTERDTWFFKLPDTDTAKYSWKVGLTGLWNMVPDYWKEAPDKIEKGLKKFTSPPYFIGT